MKNVRRIPSEEFKTTVWSGGTTTELAIGLEGSSYAERRFAYRISSAEVELESSVFTRLEGVTRFLTPLCRGFSLRINGEEKELPRGEVLKFSGEDDVFCRGSGRDLNLMLKGAEGNMKYVCGGFSVYDCSAAFLYCPERTAVSSAGEEETFPAGAFLRLMKGDHAVSRPAVLFLIDADPKQNI